MTISKLNWNIPYGLPVPPHTPHAILVSLPTWQDTVTCIEGEDVETRANGYPRFFIQQGVRKLSSILKEKYGLDEESCLLFPSFQDAEQCKIYLQSRSITARVVSLVDSLSEKLEDAARIIECRKSTNLPRHPSSANQLHVVFFPTDDLEVAKLFWQHTGTGISSRFADRWLSLCPTGAQANGSSPQALEPQGNRVLSGLAGADPSRDLNQPLTDAASAKRALRRRIASILNTGQKKLPPGLNTSGAESVSDSDVYLFPTGMKAVWEAHQLVLSVRPTKKSACFGFVYCDTLKVLEKWGPGCHFFPEGTERNIDQLEDILEHESARDPDKPPILALFTEFPSNPLLHSSNLPRLRALADKYDFLMMVDDTVGSSVNVDVLPYADIVVTSLSKIFSGSADVMGGSIVLNPNRRHYAALTVHMSAHYEDTYYDEDAIQMETNSRNLQQRIQIIDANAEALCEFLRSHSVAASADNTIIKEVFYPKYRTPQNYERCCKKLGNYEGSPNEGGGYGGLLSITFTSNAASRAFYEALGCFKAPSLGTNFTLAVLYTILAHHDELEWAAQCGVEEGLVRVSVGMENQEKILRTFEVALNVAKNAVRDCPL